jgi:hypothetical protein
MEEDVHGLRQLITGSLSFESVAYILIHTDEDSVLVDTYNGDIPQELLERSKSTVDLEKPPELVYISESDVECFDIWEPVEEGYLGLRNELNINIGNIWNNTVRYYCCFIFS